jgi:hypothetical protein
MKNFYFSTHISVTTFDIIKWQGVEPLHGHENEITVPLMETDWVIGKCQMLPQ